MKLVVGLGNPGNKCNNTRHNLGFMLLDKIGFSNAKTKFDGEYVKLNIKGEDIILLKPQKYINLSGEVIVKYLHYFKISKEDLIVIHDDLDMNLGQIKICYNHSSGGHNGIKNIESMLGNKEYWRLKIGIGKNNNIDPIDYVLGKFSAEEITIIDHSLDNLSNLLEEIVTEGMKKLQQKYNQK